MDRLGPPPEELRLFFTRLVMGGPLFTYRWLTDLARVLREAGLTVVELDGWERRGRPASTGAFAPVGVLWHHTGASSDGREYAEWMALTGRSDLPAPLCQLAVGRDGTWYVCAAGRANHAGAAKPSGSVAGGDGNSLYLGVECMNNGGEGWIPTQYDAMVRGGAALGHYLRCTTAAQRAHRETSLTGKWDPGALDMDKFRRDIAAAMMEEDPVTPEDIDKIAAAVVKRLLNTDLTPRNDENETTVRGALNKIARLGETRPK